MSKLFLFVVIVFGVIAISRPVRSQTSIVVDHVDGLVAVDTIAADGAVTFYLRLRNYNEWGANLRGATNAFKIFSPDGAVWAPVTAAEVVDMSSYFDMLNVLGYLSANGSGVDTVYVILTVAMLPGLPYGFDEIAYRISTELDGDQVGKTLCLDSSSFMVPSGMWLWAYGSQVGTLRPDWSGPHCYTIFRCCRQRGDVDYSGGDMVDIADLIYLSDYMFAGGPPPPCFAHADADGDGMRPLNIADLIYLVDYMFADGPEPVPCERFLAD